MALYCRESRPPPLGTTKTTSSSARCRSVWLPRSDVGREMMMSGGSSITGRSALCRPDDRSGDDCCSPVPRRSTAALEDPGIGSGTSVVRPGDVTLSLRSDSAKLESSPSASNIGMLLPCRCVVTLPNHDRQVQLAGNLEL